MKISLLFLLLTLFSCINKYDKDYPIEINEIKEVVLERPDKKSNEKFSQIKQLNQQEIELLLDVLKKSEYIESKSFTVDFYIVFSTESGTKRIMVDDNKIKFFNNDKIYQIETINFLKDF